MNYYTTVIKHSIRIGQFRLFAVLDFCKTWRCYENIITESNENHLKSIFCVRGLIGLVSSLVTEWNGDQRAGYYRDINSLNVL